MKSSILALIILALYSCSSTTTQQAAAPPPSLPVTTVIAVSDTTYQEYPASIQGKVDVEIRPQVNGILDKIYVDEGAFVNAGQPLFKINDNPYRAILNNALASQQAAEAALINAQIEIDKLTPLVENKVVSEYELKKARASYAVVKANIEQAKANVSSAKINLGYTVISAPVSGYIGLLAKKQGSLVAPNDPGALTELSETNKMHVYFALGEKDFVNFKDQYQGLTLKDKIDHLPPVMLVLPDESIYAAIGNIDAIGGQFDKNTGAVTLRATFPNARGLLRSGNTGKIRLSLLHKDILEVPQSATVEVQDKVFVFGLADSNKVKKLAISIIGKSGTNYLVKDGVKEGDRIVLSGLDHLQEGSVIVPQKQENKLTKN